MRKWSNRNERLQFKSTGLEGNERGLDEFFLRSHGLPCLPDAAWICATRGWISQVKLNHLIKGMSGVMFYITSHSTYVSFLKIGLH